MPSIVIKSLLFQLSFLLIFTTKISPQNLPSLHAASQGEWNLLRESIGISAMHMQLLHDNRVIMYDRTDTGRSNISLSGGRCRFDPYDTTLQTDCTAHSVLYDVATNTVRPLMVQTDTWCSSGAVLPNGTLVQTGGFNDGDHAVRAFTPCADDSCDWVENQLYLSERRWYATNQILPDGRIIIVGGRRQFNYEFYPRNDDASSSSQSVMFHFLRETRDYGENNLYPFVHLLPDGNLFIFANTRSVLLDYKHDHVLKEFPEIPGGDPRNYPSSGSSVLLPLDESNGTTGTAVKAEIMICGGAPKGSFGEATTGVFLRALSTCGRLMVSYTNPSWAMEEMPLPRVMGDMILLPTGDVLIINGAALGTAGWELGLKPVIRPIIYRPYENTTGRFSVMAPASRPRMYHSSAVLLTDGRVLIGGSNPHVYYNFTGVLYPTDLSLEAYSPPYLSTEYKILRPRILSLDETFAYGASFRISSSVQDFLGASLVSVRLATPSFTTHSLGMNQRMVVLRLLDVSHLTSYVYNLTAVAPSTAEIAPPGYYMLFVVHAGVPSSGVWVKLG